MHEIQETIEIKNSDTDVFFNIRIGKRRSLFDAAMAKVAFLQGLARKRNAYAFVRLHEVAGQIDEAAQEVTKQINSFKSKLKQELGENPKINQQVKTTKEFSFSNPVHFALIKILKDYDNLVSLLLMARSAGIFVHQNTFYVVKSRVRKNILQMLSKLVRLSSKEFSEATLEDYISESDTYTKGVEKFGELHMQALYNAVISPATPTLSPKELNVFTAELKKKLEQVSAESN